MEKVTLKQLRYFEAVVAQGHFGRAADVCAISQPAISVQIKELELAAGQKLFRRHAKTIQLTSFGEVFAAKVRPILRAVDDLSDLARVSSETLAGRVKLGIIPTVGPYLLPQIVTSVSAKYPDVDLLVRETQTSNLILDVQNGALDAALLALPVSEESLVERPLFDERFVLIRSADDQTPPPLNAESLRKMRLLLLEEGHCFRDQALSFCGGTVARPNETLDGSSLSTLVQMTASGLGVTLIPEMAIPLETRTSNVAVTYFPSQEPKRTIGMVWRQNSPLSPHLETLSETIASTATKLTRQEG